MDIVSYLVFTKRFYTGEQMKAFKSSGAFKYYEAGLLFHVGARKQDPSIIVVGKVSYKYYFLHLFIYHNMSCC